MKSLIILKAHIKNICGEFRRWSPSAPNLLVWAKNTLFWRQSTTTQGGISSLFREIKSFLRSI